MSTTLGNERYHWFDGKILRPDGSRVVHCSLNTSIPVISELHRLGRRIAHLECALTSACEMIEQNAQAAGFKTTVEEQVAYHMAKTEDAE